MRLARILAVGAIAVMALSAAPALADSLPPGGSFLDDDENVHESMIEAIAADAITKGCNPPANDRYCPGDAVSRGQMAAFMVRALNLPASSTNYFDDDDSSIFQADIQALRRAGVTKGCNPPANDRFCPANPVTRGEMAAFLTRAFDYAATSTNYFGDDETSVFERDINALAAAGVTKGCNPPSNTNFCPAAQVERDQMASFLGRALGLSPVALPQRLSLIDDFALDCFEIGDPSWIDCTAEGVWPANERFYIRHGWGEGDSFFRDADTEFRLFVNGTRQEVFPTGVYDNGEETVRLWTKDFPAGQPAGVTEFVGQWIEDGELGLEVEVNVTFE